MKKINALLKYVFYLLSTWVLLIPDLVFPKKKELWVIASHLGLVGNARFLAEHLLENKPQIRVCFYSFHAGGGQDRSESYFEERYGGRFKLLKRKNLTALVTALRSRHIFISHDLARDVGFPLTALRGRRQVINLWHGIAMKKHWLLKKYDLPTTHRAKARQFSKVIASSPLDALAKAGSFQKSLDDIWITGNPRSDILMGKALPRDLLEQEQQLREELKGRLMVLYAPTWRSYGGRFEPFPAGALDRLARILDKNNHVLGLRLHMKDELKFKKLYSSSAFLNLGSERYPETEVLLKNTAILVTDYSSIGLDFLLTGRPLLAYWYDLQDYSKKRGFLWDLVELYPGTKVYTYTELVAALGELVSGEQLPGLAPGYRFARGLFHRYSDGKCAERVVDSAVPIPQQQ